MPAQLLVGADYQGTAALFSQVGNDRYEEGIGSPVT